MDHFGQYGAFELKVSFIGAFLEDDRGTTMVEVLRPGLGRLEGSTAGGGLGFYSTVVYTAEVASAPSREEGNGPDGTSKEDFKGVLSGEIGAEGRVPPPPRGGEAKEGKISDGAGEGRFSTE
ncbi:hypothetical protein NE237_018116 [Protea cynaroides]|uniref:Uncharacterized protein n=1 Tax=Protea cynaroides TaxID=273540 RepID=A0A9Q0QNP4_9MAGN|nr:hypothetical protein NE237_018116 [Protea cynaroides]